MQNRLSLACFSHVARQLATSICPVHIGRLSLRTALNRGTLFSIFSMQRSVKFIRKLTFLVLRLCRARRPHGFSCLLCSAPWVRRQHSHPCAALMCTSAGFANMSEGPTEAVSFRCAPRKLPQKQRILVLWPNLQTGERREVRQLRCFRPSCLIEQTSTVQ